MVRKKDSYPKILLLVEISIENEDKKKLLYKKRQDRNF